MVGFNYTKVSLFSKVIRTLFKSDGSLIALSYQEVMLTYSALLV